MKWQLDDAEARFEEVFDAAIQSGPQFLMDGEKEIAVVVSLEEYERRRSAGRQAFER